MTKLETKLNNIKKESFIITIEKGIDEVLFSYVKKYDAVMVSNVCYYSSADYYRMTEINELVRLYEEFENIIK
tara:strand:+ start:104 stop:322 length:219 start_codon:yes stop_codon:yes gene_type:complete